MVPPKAPTVLVLKKAEWDRLKSAAEPPQPPPVEKAEYLQKLNERSREWRKTWPDSLEGFVAKATKLREKKRQTEREMVIKYKEIERLKTLIDYEVVEGAKQQIFNDSCYGKQLISALLESKVIEEREAQIEFNNKRKKEALQLAKEEELMNTLQIGLKNEEKILKRKEINKKLAEEYKAIVEETKRKQTEEREKEILGEIEDARLMKQLLDIEAHDMDHCKLKAIEEAGLHVEDQKYYRKIKEIRDKEDDALVQVWKKYHERVRCKEQEVMDKIHKARNDLPELKLICQKVEKIHDEKQKRYDEFVQKGIDKFDKRTVEEDQKEAMKQSNIKEQFLQYAKDNKLQGELLKSYCHANNCVCERQTLAMKKTNNPKYGKKKVEINKEDTQSFMNPSVLEESTVCKKDLEPCKCNCKKEYPAMKMSFTDASISMEPTKGSSKTAYLKTASVRTLRSMEMSSTNPTPYSNKYEETRTPSSKSLETSYLNKYLEVTLTNDSLLVSPPSSETSSSKYKTEDKYTEESKEGELMPPICKDYSENKSVGRKGQKENKSEMKKIAANEGAVPSFVKPKNKLIEALKEREKEPTPWTGLKGAHEYFAKQASGILKECRYMKMAQKVIDEYKKVNCLDTLPDSNWN